MPLKAILVCFTTIYTKAIIFRVQSPNDDWDKANPNSVADKQPICLCKQ
jgi:hypothetical protein